MSMTSSQEYMLRRRVCISPWRAPIVSGHHKVELLVEFGLVDGVVAGQREHPS